MDDSSETCNDKVITPCEIKACSPRFKVSLRNSASVDIKPQSSIMRSGLYSPTKKKRVDFVHSSFPVTEVYASGPLFTDSVSVRDVLHEYFMECEKLKIKPLEKVIKQLGVYDVIDDRIPELSLRGTKLDFKACEALEIIFMNVQVEILNLESTMLDEDSCVSIVEIIDHYCTAKCLCIGSNTRIGVRGWAALSQLVSRSSVLEQIDLNRMVFTEQAVTTLSKAMRVSNSLRVIHLENCYLNGQRLKNLLSMLADSIIIEEIYLGENKIGPLDCEYIADLLRRNPGVKLVDLQSNPVQDNGLKLICNSLIEQGDSRFESFQLWNTGLTETGMSYLVPYFCKEVFTGSSCTLRSLNLGKNKIGDGGLSVLKDGLIKNHSIQRLGLASTKLTSEGVIMIAEIIAENRVLLRVDIRGNNCAFGGLIALSQAMRHNSTLVKLNFDQNLKPDTDMQEEVGRIINEIVDKCQENHNRSRLAGAIDDAMSLLSIFSSESLAHTKESTSTHSSNSVSSFFLNIISAPWRFSRTRLFGSSSKSEDASVIQVAESAPNLLAIPSQPQEAANKEEVVSSQPTPAAVQQPGSSTSQTVDNLCPCEIIITSSSPPIPDRFTGSPPSRRPGPGSPTVSVSRFEVRKVAPGGAVIHRRTKSDTPGYKPSQGLFFLPTGRPSRSFIHYVESQNAFRPLVSSERVEDSVAPPPGADSEQAPEKSISTPTSQESSNASIDPNGQSRMPSVPMDTGGGVIADFLTHDHIGGEITTPHPLLEGGEPSQTLVP